MNRTVYVHLVLLLSLLACNKSTNTSSEASGQTTDMAQGKVPAKKIKFIDAGMLFKAYGREVRLTLRPTYPCSSRTDTLRCLWVPKGHGDEHFPFKEADLPKPASAYSGIHIYPYVELNNKSRYILAYTENGAGGKITDKADEYYVITLNKNKDFDWCHLAETVKSTDSESMLTNHHICNPNCPEYDDASLKF